MKTIYWLHRIAGVLVFCGAATVQAQTSAAAGSVIVFPVVAFTPSFTSEVSVQNRNDTDLNLDVLYYEANNANDPGFHDCGQFAVPAGQSLSFFVGTQCPPETGVTHFGELVLKNHDAADQTKVFYAYSRAETPQGVGFSIEGFPIGNFSGATSYALGLKRSSSGAKYATNCYVAALGEAVDYTLTLYNGNDGTESSPLGSKSLSLQPYDSHRHTEVFSALGAPPGDYTNVRAKFQVTNTNPVTGGIPGYIGFCTVQESNTFSADFRIAKSQDALDFRQKRRTCYGQSSCGVVLTGSSATNVVAATDRNIHSLFIAQPDFVKCDLVGDAPTLAQLQIRIREPGDVASSPVFVPSPPYDGAPFTAGGATAKGFYFYTGERSEWNLGSTDRWFIDVEATDGSSGVLDYGITCTSGNGVSVPYIRTVTTRIPDASF